MPAAFVYVTVGNEDDALRIGKEIVRERLAACANVLDGMTSVFWWEGDVQDEAETVLILKTRADLFDRLSARVQELHPYECPCVISWPVTHANPDYLAWIESETTP